MPLIKMIAAFTAPAALLFLCLFSGDLHAQETKILKFKDSRLSSSPSGYYIHDVQDDRSDTTSIGSIRAGVLSRKMVLLDLDGGVARGLYTFLSTHLRQDSLQAIPLSLHVSRLEAGEKTGGLNADAEVLMTLSFYSGNRKLLEYSGGSSVHAGIDAGKYIEGLIRQSLDTILQQFNKAFLANRANILSSVKGPSVLVKVAFPRESPDSGMIVYDPGSPLRLDDFRGKPDNYLPASAGTYSGIDIRFVTETVFGQARVTVSITAFFDRTRSWCKPGQRNEETLQHEQRHFDITALKACELAVAIGRYSFTDRNYMKELDSLYRQKQTETNQLQDQYDAETGHGQVKAQQQAWDQSIRDRLRALSCYQH